MKSLNSRAFLAAWRMMCNASNPGLTRDRWTCDDVDWVRETHAFTGPEIAFRVETHTLTLKRRDRVAWSLLVVVEHWWVPGKTAALKSVEWCRPLAGSSRQILAWFQERA